MSKQSRAKTGAAGWLKEKWPALAVLAVVVAGVLVIIAKSNQQSGPSALVEVEVPALSTLARQGAAAFGENCAQCHGRNGGGGPGGPPLVHDIYNAGHHGDAAFRFAMQRGVRQHHWRFGNMPPQPQVGEAQAQAIIRYVRELQMANGIRTRLHRMQ